ncbi:glycoside hydrolase family 97 protein [Rapidithrix thailandica]|uniref:Glycoside hydrolase family 97 protein n=1 Tax=Rapidithrix thailandica TaxID=413964 RepID=A0AAW9SEC2_9BACT
MKKMNVLAGLLSCLMFLATLPSMGKEYVLQSPDQKIEVKISVEEDIRYQVHFNGELLLSPSGISMALEGGEVLGTHPKVRKVKRQSVNRSLAPVIRQKSATISDRFEEMTLQFRGDYTLVFRAYDDGVAYRFTTSRKEALTVTNEQVEFNFNADHSMYFPEETDMMTHMERTYLHLPMSEVNGKRFCSIPALVEIDNGPKVLITEADLEDYPGMFLKNNDNASHGFQGIFPKVALEEKQTNDRDVKVEQRADYMAKTQGERSFPWRVLIIAEEDGDLIESQLVYQLAKPLQLEDTSWIKTGKVAWDWWNANNISGVDFRAGVNTETYKYFIDFASDYGLEYIILDEGWYKLGDLMSVVPEIDMEELIAYGKEKNVAIILWVVWKTLDDQLEEALNQFEKWGVKGIKVDFMQRDDQKIVNYYHRVAKEAAKRKLLVNFHGSYKPTGIRRAYPNVITREGVKGLEQSKWGETADPQNALVIPFTRMVAGPVDYTPGAMLNATKQNFKPVFNKPMSQGTRCHQLAMYVVFESPLQMLADNPTHYRKEPECMEFLSAVPVVWDATKVLDAKVGNYVLITRQHGEEWYMGAMTNWTARDLEVDFSFLPEGETYQMDIYQDGINADRNAQDYKKTRKTVTKNSKLNIHLAPGGGWVARLRKD